MGFLSLVLGVYVKNFYAAIAGCTKDKIRI